jgi:hypothetical protein
MQPESLSPLDRLPPPRDIHTHMGRLHQELALLRRLLRLAQSAQEQRRGGEPPDGSREVSHAR